MPVIINSINRQAIRATPHIVIKGLKGVAPLIAHPNATASIMSITGIIGIKAALLCAMPCTILFIMGHSVHPGLPVYFKAATTSYSATSQVAHKYNRSVATCAKTTPHTLPAMTLKFNCSQAPKLLTRQIFKIVGMFDTVIFSHTVHPFMMNDWLEPFRWLHTGRLV
jgi:hypothetical protein